MTGKGDGGGDGKSICRPVVVIRGEVGTSRDKDNRNKEESGDGWEEVIEVRGGKWRQEVVVAKEEHVGSDSD